MKVSAILKGRQDKEGRITIQIRVNIGKKRHFYPLKIKVRKTQFLKGRVVNHPQASVFNSVIKREIQNREVSEVITKGTDPDFVDYGKRCIRYWREMRLKKESTLYQYESELNKIARFRSSRLSEMNNTFFSGLLSYCYKLGNLENTAWKTFAKVHAILEQAVKDDILLKNPLNKFSDAPKYKDPFPGYLTDSQIKSVEKFVHAADSEAQRFATVWFLIGCFTAFRYSDMNSFDKKKNIVEGRLIKQTVKTNSLVSLPVAGKILYYFKMINYKPLSITNEAYNRMLKVIGEKCGIDINMTVHTSRHTFGMRCANAGISIEVTSALMGHKSIKHTSIYYRISNQRVDGEIKKII